MTTPISETIPRHGGPPWWVIVWAVSGLCLGAGFAVKAGWTGNKYVRKLAPNWEYTIGNWWSAMLLLAFALLTVSCVYRRAMKARVRVGMSTLAVLGLGLSLDELGSLHERVGDATGLPSIVNLAPFAALFVLAVFWALRTLTREDAVFKPFCRLVVPGFVCLGSAEPLDAIEHAINPPPGWAPFGVVLEEGVELLGSTLLIAAAVRLISSLPVNAPTGVHPTVAAARTLGHWLIAGTLPILGLRLYFEHSGGLDLHTRGDPGAAPAAMLFALVGWTYFQRSRAGHGGTSQRLRAASVVAMLASVEMGCHLIAWIRHESVTSPLGVWWVQAIAAGAAYVWLITVTRTKPARGSTRAGAA